MKKRTEVTFFFSLAANNIKPIERIRKIEISVSNPKEKPSVSLQKTSNKIEKINRPAIAVYVVNRSLSPSKGLTLLEHPLTVHCRIGSLEI